MPPPLLPHCPICRASRTEERETCRRCGAELAWPLRLAQQARNQEQRALHALARDDLLQALLHARQARALYRTPFAQALLGFVASRAGTGNQHDDGMEEGDLPHPFFPDE